MLYKHQYSNAEEREDIINQNASKFLLEEQNITEGNFLIFSDEATLEIEILQLKQNIASLEQVVDTIIRGRIT